MPTGVRLCVVASTASKAAYLVVRRGGVTIAFSWGKAIKIFIFAIEYIFYTKKSPHHNYMRQFFVLVFVFAKQR